MSSEDTPLPSNISISVLDRDWWDVGAPDLPLGLRGGLDLFVLFPLGGLADR
ncbi:hypothetical protein DSO57_1025729 [Entomophthora muscae]|uniref:Uncharacterized protein n=1 Tax=Entomophthora muscae TaxID=34485 RepID=A0ACC2UML2_9FUNG|nr:hypothetical protein DSO57_1025729 [Entomophthora muscae]